LNKDCKKVSICFGIVLLILGMFVPARTVFADSSVNTVTTPVSQLAGKDRYATAVQISQAGWADNSSPYAVLSAGMDDNLVDALTAAPLAKLKNAPILLTQGNQLNAATKAELQRLGVKTVYVTSGLGVITQPVLDQLKAMNITVIPLGGADRFATALNIAKVVGMHGKLVVASAVSNADALSIASIAAAQGMPILLSNQDKLPDSEAAYLGSVKSDVQQTYVIGGTGVINSTVENSLPHPVRLGGANRFDTNKLVIGAFGMNFQGDAVYVANGGDSHLVDALTGSVLAAKNSTTIVLTSDPMQAATKEFLSSLYKLKKVVALGGDSVVSQSDVRNAFTYINYSDNGITIGGANNTNSEELKNSLLIAGDNLTLQNINEDYSAYIVGTNDTLDNVTINGTLYIDTGDTGIVNLDHVSADKIVVLSGEEDGIKLNNVHVNTLEISCKNKIDIAPTGDSTISNTNVSSDAILDASQGTWGSVRIIRTVSPETSIELKGSFSHDIIVNSASTVKADENSVINKVVVMPQTQDSITLDGTFEVVQIESPAQVSLASTAVLNNLVTHAETDLNVAKGAKVGHLFNGDFSTLTGEGAQDLPAVDLKDPYPIFNPEGYQTKNPALKITAPQDGAVLAYGNLTVTWAAVPGATGYTLEINDQDNPWRVQADFVTNIPAGTQSYTMTKDRIITGHHYVITVRYNMPFDPDIGYGESGLLPPIHVQVGQSPIIPPLVITSPAPGATFSFNTPIPLKWVAPADNNNLNVEVLIQGQNSVVSFSAGNGQDISQNLFTGKNQISVILRSGADVAYQGSVDITMTPSSPSSDTPDIVTPATNTTINPNQPLDITWKPVAGATDYSVYVSKEGGDMASQGVGTFHAGTLTSFQLSPLSDGKYNIFVRAEVDNTLRDGNEITVNAPKADSSIVSQPPVNIAPLQILSPTSDATFSGNDPVILQWKTPKYATNMQASVRITNSRGYSEGYWNGENINREMLPGLNVLTPGVNHILVTLSEPGSITEYQSSVDINYNP
jgi:putative cell wall-binding protein